MTPLATLAVLPALFFAPHSAWHVGKQTARACPGVSVSRCAQVASWAATIPWRGCGWCTPLQTLAVLPADGTILEVDVSAGGRSVPHTAGVWPPTVHARDVGGLEGIPPRNGVYQHFGTYDRVEAYVFAFFGRAHPTAAQLAAANAEIATVRLRP
jgi:hypothetical protein